MFFFSLQTKWRKLIICYSYVKFSNDQFSSFYRKTVTPWQTELHYQANDVWCKCNEWDGRTDRHMDDASAHLLMPAGHSIQDDTHNRTPHRQACHPGTHTNTPPSTIIIHQLHTDTGRSANYMCYGSPSQHVKYGDSCRQCPPPFTFITLAAKMINILLSYI